MILFALLIMVGLVSFSLTAIVLRYGEPLRLVQIPNHRSSHTHPTPTGGGLGIVLATTFVGLYLAWGSFQLLTILGLALPLALIGMLDDIHHLPARIRFGLQIVICLGLLLLLHSMFHFQAFSLSCLILLSFLLFSSVWWINLFNFMDGIDGLAGMQAFSMLMIAATLIIFIHPEALREPIWILLLCTASATLGFLILNWAPAQIFMGDIGSTWLAFIILALALLTIQAGWLNYAVWLVLTAAFVTDATVTLLTRMARGERWHEAHRSHVFQRLSRHWQGERRKGHKSVTLLFTFINLVWLAPLAWACIKWPSASVGWVSLAYTPLIIMAVFLGAGKEEHTRGLIPYRRHPNTVCRIDINTLLGRDPVAADPILLKSSIAGKVVMVSGAGGSIGSELCRQIIAWNPACIVLLEVSEHALYQIDRLLHTITRCKIITCLGSTQDTSLISQLIIKHGVQTIYHAAAYKQIPLIEANILETLRNNVWGTLTMVQAAFDRNVETFVLISTHKAAQPITTMMGATRRLAELIVHDFAQRSQSQKHQTHFCTVRLGNLLSENSPLIHLFKEQIAQGGPVTVTDPEMTHYFMSIHEAVELVIQSSSLTSIGDVFFLDMGEPVRLIDLARNMIHLAGHSVQDEDHPDGDIEITITGLLPNEELHEERLMAYDEAETTAHPKIMKAKEPGLNTNELAALLARLNIAVEMRDEETIRKVLMEKM